MTWLLVFLYATLKTSESFSIRDKRVYGRLFAQPHYLLHLILSLLLIVNIFLLQLCCWVHVIRDIRKHRYYALSHQFPDSPLCNLDGALGLKGRLRDKIFANCTLKSFFCHLGQNQRNHASRVVFIAEEQVADDFVICKIFMHTWFKFRF